MSDVAAPSLEAWAVAILPADNGSWMIFEPRTGRRICWCQKADADLIVTMRAAWLKDQVPATTGGQA